MNKTINNWTNQTDYIFSAKPTNPKAIIQLAQSVYVNGIEVKEKSSKLFKTNIVSKKNNK